MIIEPLVPSSPRRIDAHRVAIRDAVRATKGYQGILGQSITFDDKGDVATPTLYVYQVKGIGFELIKPVMRQLTAASATATHGALRGGRAEEELRRVTSRPELRFPDE